MQDCDLTDTLFMHTNLEGADLCGSHSFYIDIRENKTAKATNLILMNKATVRLLVTCRSLV